MKKKRSWFTIALIALLTIALGVLLALILNPKEEILREQTEGVSIVRLS